ncbi:MAG: SPOR domain-containing protein [Candidatus Endonucleobacter bathymodioli]|uniref:SPOR domain-containing protein n=1 Tax=Candidatus Endonucleibacter bathymodioli TaxID=539814 RepID=A0AA90NNS8_9GAMM|nr:SPOR domain-containing protein [Candidatus Endonucleobacter bathymodioli]
MRSRSALKRGASKARKCSDNKAYLSGMPSWLWLLTGLAVGFFVALLFEFSPSAVDTQKVTESSELVEKDSGPEPVFDFYRLLPESDINLYGAGVSNPAPKHAAKPDNKEEQEELVSKNEDSARYLLQAGSFRSRKDADRLKVQLLLWGLSPNIKKVTVGSGGSWHRVQLGPFEDKQALYRAQQLLAEHNVDSLMLKMR